MTNTIKNKAKFFALYWGQDVVTLDGINEIPVYRMFNPIRTEETQSRAYLELTPLSQISDEDAIEVYRMVLYEEHHYKHYNLSIKDEIKQGKSCAESSLRLRGGYCGFSVGTGAYVSDYLRSRGYALPWMGISVEQLVQYGWVKLKV